MFSICCSTAMFESASVKKEMIVCDLPPTCWSLLDHIVDMALWEHEGAFPMWYQYDAAYVNGHNKAVKGVQDAVPIQHAMSQFPAVAGNC